MKKSAIILIILSLLCFLFSSCDDSKPKDNVNTLPISKTNDETNTTTNQLDYAQTDAAQTSSVNSCDEASLNMVQTELSELEDEDRDYYTVFYKSENNFNAFFDIKLKKSLNSDVTQKMSASDKSYKKVHCNNAEVFCTTDSNSSSLIYYVYADGYEMTAVVRNAEKEVADLAFSDIRFGYFSE